MKPASVQHNNQAIPRTQEAGSLKKSNHNKPFFGDASQESFFKPSSANQQPQLLHRKCADCEKEENVQRQEGDAQTPVANMSVNSAYINSLNAGGDPMNQSAQKFFSSRFGQDFGDVKIHTDNQAATSAKAINAKA